MRREIIQNKIIYQKCYGGGDLNLLITISETKI